MSAIFLSYRHEDAGWARGLYDQLGQTFDVFFDPKIQGGAEYEPELEEAVRDCRVFFAVIGPRWVADDQLARLADPKDWVNRELSLALGRGRDVRVVPLLIEKTQLPPELSLPETLRALRGRQAVRLTNARWELEITELKEQLEIWLAKGAAPRSNRRQPPDELPYLCDRVEPEDALIDLIGTEAARSPAFSCVLPGHKHEQHDGFLKRLEYQGTLEKILGSTNEGIAIHRLELNRQDAGAGKFDVLLKRTIKRVALQNPVADDAALSKFLLAGLQPRIFVLQITGADYGALGRRLLDGLASAFRALFAGGTPQRISILWLNFSYGESDQQSLEVDVPGLLPALRQIERSDVVDWMEKTGVQRFVAGRELRLTREIEARGTLHMLDFAEVVHKVLSTG